jgi:hypothetical protein
MDNWNKIAHHIEVNYGSLVDWDDRFFYCPECHEPIYEDEWVDFDFLDGNNNFICPV